MTLILSADDLAGLVTLPEAIGAVRAAHAELAAGQASQPAPVALGSSVSSSVMLPMVASSGRLNLSVVKALTDAPDNRGRGLPTQRSVIVVLDSTTGECLAIIDGAVVTRARTAAASAVATGALANPDATTLGLVGAGRLAIEHVAAIRTVRPISQIRVWSRSVDTLAAFRAAVGADIAISVESSPADVVASSDIVCTLTPSQDADRVRGMVPSGTPPECRRGAAARRPPRDRCRRHGGRDGLRRQHRHPAGQVG